MDLEYTEFEGPDGIPLRVPANDDYRTVQGRALACECAIHEYGCDH